MKLDLRVRMLPSSTIVAVAVAVAALSLLPAPATGQDPCPSATGPEAEAGWAAYQAGDMELARRHFAAAIAQCDNDHYSRTGLGYVELREGNEASAETLFGRVLRAEPNNVDALVGMGLVAWRAADLGGVREHFSLALELAPGHPTALEYLARVQGRAVETASPGTDEADEAWRTGDTDRAFRLYTIRLETNPDDDRALHRLALVHAWREEYRRSLELFDRLLQTAPRNIDARVDRARVSAWRGDADAALAELDRILAEHPDHPGALEARALFQAWEGRYEESLTSYERLLSISPDNGGARRQQAQVMAWASDYRGSRRLYEELLTEDPGDLDARLGLARTLAFADDLDGALAQYDRVLERVPTHLGAMQGKSRTLAWADRLVEAEALVRAALAVDEEAAPSWVVLGQVLQWQGRNAAALGALERAVELSPTNGEAHDQLRAVRLTLAPLARPSTMYAFDSDDNRMWTTSLAARFHPVPRLELGVDAYRRGLTQNAIERSSFGAVASLTWTAEPGWRLSAGLGGSATDAAGSPAHLAARAGIRSPERNAVRASIDVSTQALDETAALAENGVRFTTVDGGVRWKPAFGWRVDAALGYGVFEGSERNTRISGALAASRRVGRAFAIGASVRTFGYDKDLVDGYFDPAFYGIGELTGYWRHAPRPWSFLIEAAPGVQQVTTSGDPTFTLRGSARLGYMVGPARELSLSYGFSTAGLVSFSTGGSDYRYNALILALDWVF